MKKLPIAAVIIERDNKILMHRRGYEPGKGKICLVGGFVDKGETIERAAIREAKEETGFDVKLGERLIIMDYFDRQEKTMHVFIAEVVGGNIRNSDEGKPVWVHPDSIEEDMLAFDHVLPVLTEIYLRRKPGKESN
jgi:ADP-ribose pyrophosphatase YjhB (NUDIX family)